MNRIIKSNATKILTIAIPSYNIGRYIDRSVSSIISSGAINDIELLIVNDGSTDDTYKKSIRYCEEYPDNVFIINKENGHYGSAINIAIQNASGKYFKILDGDDEFNPRGLANLVSFLKNIDPTDMIITDYETVFESSERIKRSCFYIHPRINLQFDNITGLSPVSMHALTFRTYVLQEHDIRLDEGIAFTDAEYMLYPIPYIEYVTYLPELVYSYKIGRPGQSADLSYVDKNMYSHTKVVKSCLSWFNSVLPSLSEAKRLYISTRIARLIDDHVYRCLISSNPNQYLRDLKEICSSDIFQENIKHYTKSHALKILLMTNFHSYIPISRYMRNKIMRQQ